mmetsp:Transcript_13577/g.27786  ORF Transcript_13577/g.27786 Transcript_13577/m.27786 type:complete len:102 (-) Transcript_13577:356-661(-)
MAGPKCGGAVQRDTFPPSQSVLISQLVLGERVRNTMMGPFLLWAGVKTAAVPVVGRSTLPATADARLPSGDLRASPARLRLGCVAPGAPSSLSFLDRFFSS